jgi:glycosyltransferase involved in cell wall biosynthesis
MSASSSPTVTIIVSYLNAKRFLSEAIDSVVGQTFDDWELALVDDGSSDGSTEIGRQRVQEIGDKARYLEHAGHRNLGLPAARNVALREARGRYVAVLDSDDVWEPSKLEEQVGLLDAHPGVALVCGGSLYWQSWTGRPEDSGRDVVQRPRIAANRVYEPPSLLRLHAAGQAFSPCPSDLLFRRAPIQRLGGFVDQFGHPFTMYEDQAFFARVFLHCAVLVADTCWDRYRLHPDSCCAVGERTGLAAPAYRFYLSWFERYLREQGVEDRVAWSGLRRRRWQYDHPKLARLASHAMTARHAWRGVTRGA